MTEKKRELLLDGVRAGLPIMLGYVPIGIAYAVMARQAGLSVGQTYLMSLTVYAGASQMMIARDESAIFIKRRCSHSVRNLR